MSWRITSRSVDIYVIPSEARNLTTANNDCRVRFFTPLRCVQDDMIGRRRLSTHYKHRRNS